MAAYTFTPGSGRRRWHTTLATAALAICTLITPTLAQDKTAADYYVHSLPGAPEPLLPMYAGHVEITPEHHGNMFFWFYKNRHIANRRRTVLWLNGGPGCSSMDGAMMEIGPYRVNEDGTLRLNEGSWDEFANVLFIDNPVGTGFSYIDTDSYLHELDEMASDMIKFLEKWFTMFPEHAHDDIYIAGESYAGQHIPYIASAILDRNALSQNPWNLSGLLIGNGWISGPDQYPAYIKFAKENGLVKDNTPDSDKLDAQLAVCNRDLSNGGADHVDTGTCEAILQEILRISSQNNGGQCLNMYDVRLKDSYPSCGMNWPPDLKQVTPYLRRTDVTQALHINPDKKTGWTECNGNVGGAFNAAKSKPAVKLLPALLEKVPIILFSGDRDLICNHIGTENLINSLSWNGGTGMELSPGTTAPRRDWTFEGEPAGIYQEARNLTYIKFYNSSHMVPFDYPRRTRDMLDRFMGVDIGSIGGKPTDSVIDGEKAPSTSVGGHPNSTAAKEAEAEKVQMATWRAYKRSGEVALVLVLIAALAWGYFIYRDRRRRAGYKGVFGGEGGYSDGGPGAGREREPSLASGLGLDGWGERRNNKNQERDVEAARAYDEAELDDLTENGRKEDAFELGESDDEDGHVGRGNGHAR
nr:Pheromone-processing carboxypeptidase kex1 [Rachicladosporium sp. CCFEE 5018]